MTWQGLTPQEELEWQRLRADHKATILTDQERTIERLAQEKAELLAALKALLTTLDDDRLDKIAIEAQARAAIKKAEGGE